MKVRILPSQQTLKYIWYFGVFLLHLCMEKIEINSGHYLELMDRLHVVMCNLNDHCIEHPLAQSDEEIKFKIEYAVGQLWDAYQLVGNKEEDYENENNTH